MDVAAIDDENIVLRFVRGRFAGGNLAFETALGGIVFEEVSQIVGGDDIADGDDFDILADHALFRDGAENEPANASKSIDCNFNCHIFNSFSNLSGVITEVGRDNTAAAPIVNEISNPAFLLHRLLLFLPP